MPVYEFECQACGHRFSEFFRKMVSSQEGTAPTCPECQSAATRRVVSSFAAQGPARVDTQEVAAQKASETRKASVTAKEQINAWRKGR